MYIYKNIINDQRLSLTTMLYRARRSKELHRFFFPMMFNVRKKIGNHRSPMMLPLLLHMQQLLYASPIIIIVVVPSSSLCLSVYVRRFLFVYNNNKVLQLFWTKKKKGPTEKFSIRWVLRLARERPYAGPRSFSTYFIVLDPKYYTGTQIG